MVFNGKISQVASRSTSDDVELHVSHDIILGNAFAVRVDHPKVVLSPDGSVSSRVPQEYSSSVISWGTGAIVMHYAEFVLAPEMSTVGC